MEKHIQVQYVFLSVQKRGRTLINKGNLSAEIARKPLTYLARPL
jgi:hypothetical protein